MPSTKPGLGRHLAQLRALRGWTLRGAAKKAGMSPGMLSMLENDKVQTPHPLFLFDLARTYESSYGDLMRLARYPLPDPRPEPAPPLVPGLDLLSPDDLDEIRTLVRMKVRRRAAPPATKPARPIALRTVRPG